MSKQLANPTHPNSRFTIGNIDTLSKVRYEISHTTNICIRCLTLHGWTVFLLATSYMALVQCIVHSAHWWQVDNEKLVNWYKSHYSSNLMHITVNARIARITCLLHE